MEGNTSKEAVDDEASQPTNQPTEQLFNLSGLEDRKTKTPRGPLSESQLFFAALACHYLVLDGFDQLLSFAQPTL